MKTDVIEISNRGNGMEQALRQAEKVAAYKGLEDRSARQLRLLTEEMMGLMRAVTGEKTGRFWIEDEDGIYRLHLKVETRMTSTKREQLLSASTSGKNESATGLMGRLRDFFEQGSDEDIAAVSSPMLLPEMEGVFGASPLDWEWSMTEYQRQLQTLVASSTRAQALWDELEKSVVTHVADDVRVSIRGRQVEMTIDKKLA